MKDFEFPSIKQVIFILCFNYLMRTLLPLLFKLRKKEVKLNKIDWKKDVVYLFQFPRIRVSPNLSPFCLKVETWLRLKNIPYEVIESMTVRSKEGKLPFVELNGEQIADSQLIINKLSKQFNKEDGLSAKDWAISQSLDRMVEDSLIGYQVFSCLAVFKVAENGPKMLHSSVIGHKLPSFLTDLGGHILGYMVKNRLRNLGTGKHDRADILDIQRRDLQALSYALADKKFFFGDQPMSVDCTVFGHLASTYYLPYDQPVKQLLDEEFTNLRDFLESVKEKIYPDWQSLLAK